MGLTNLLFGNAKQSDKVKITIETDKGKIVEYFEIPDSLKDQSELTKIKRDTYLKKLICEKYLRKNTAVSQVTANYRGNSVEVWMEKKLK